MLIDEKKKSPEDGKKGQLPKIEVKLNEVGVNALIDSGCVGDFVSLDFVNKYRFEIHPTVPQVLVTATKSKS